MNEASLAEAPAASSPPDDGTTLSAERPFPGLRPFGFTDRAFFFGRERQTYALYRLVEGGRFIAVIGSSGCGKSSLVLAGLQGILAEETADSGGPSWRFLDMRPGGAPITRLARALGELSNQDSPDAAARRRDRIEWTLRQSSFSFERALEEAGGLNGKSLLLVVDQFEELFRFGLAGLALRKTSLEDMRARDEATQFVQILLDADRRRLKDVHVLITMRSDFIGDCAYFHGLSEAVSATQYLVPNLTRGQLEDVIRKPVDQVGAAIEPELVERLINDCGDELDQLPVLQHCLMRLWDRAGAASDDRPRKLTRQTYEDVGRMAEALSRHADEVLAQCADKELAVEQSFRALSELDREGRAVRRALRFDRLLAESGIPEADLRGVLDRFRAPGCAFLAPPLAGTPTLSPDDRVDIGHETLLRRWRKLSGRVGEVDPKTGRPRLGWLGEEQSDGQVYRVLLSLLGDGAEEERAALKDPLGTKRWWDSLPRTPEWAERYGGNFDRVRTLIDDSVAERQRSIEAERRSKRNRMIGWATAVTSAVIIAGLFGWQAYSARVREQEAASVGAMSAAKDLLDQFLDGYIKGNITEGSSRTLTRVIDNFIGKVKGASDTVSAQKLWVQMLNVQSDLAANFTAAQDALALAREAEKTAQSLVSRMPNDTDSLQAEYDSKVRVGDALLSAPAAPGAYETAFRVYSDALSDSLKLQQLNPGENAIDDEAKIHLKLGDVYKNRAQRSLDEARKEYRESLAISERLVAKYPRDKDALRDRGAAYYRIGVAENVAGRSQEAFEAFTRARLDQQALIERFADDETLKSNLAATNIRLGDHWVKENALLEALAEYQEGVQLQEQIIANDPKSPRYRDWLAPDYEKLAAVQDRLNLISQARLTRRNTYTNARELRQLDQANDNWQARYALAAKNFGDLVRGDFRLEIYKEALGTWQKLASKPSARREILNTYNDHMQIGDAFALSKDWADAAGAYTAAANIARFNVESHPLQADLWQEKATSAARLSETASEAAGHPFQ